MTTNSNKFLADLKQPKEAKLAISRMAKGTIKLGDSAVVSKDLMRAKGKAVIANMLGDDPSERSATSTMTLAWPLLDKTLAIGETHRIKQRKNALLSKNRIKIDEGRIAFSISHLCDALVKKRDAMNDPMDSSELWDDLVGMLNEKNLSTSEKRTPSNLPVSMTYVTNSTTGKRATLTYSSFKTMLSKAKK